MLSILLVGKDPDGLADLSTALQNEEGIRVDRAASGQEAWDFLANHQVDVAVMDQQLADGEALPFVKQLVKKNPLINCAMVSTLAAEDFHEATEGLGVFMQLPVHPGSEEAANMLQLLQSIGALMAQQ
ncbi:response regulator [Desulfopila sp. IMCC35006]|uniref:response regulator n=1 Tax=Desulfopila sp. IMCC35006 TaxID=2569542 RepID=UPI0010ACB752|nr:response regulator [Desulfopila sp. IMCC35006]TKB24016.1 response regulator [Desulfopila sp. IMCC35006]